MTRLEYLKKHQAALDALIENEQAKPNFDSTNLTNLKMQKLACKDELEEIENERT